MKYSKFSVDSDLKYNQFDKIINYTIMNNKGLYIFGKSGVGKTTLLSKILYKIEKNNKNFEKKYVDWNFELDDEVKSKTTFKDYIGELRKIEIGYANMAKLISDVQKTWNKNFDSNLQNVNLETLTNKQFLIIDDIGTEYVHKTIYPYLYNLMELRLNFINANPKIKCVTIFTSNFSLIELQASYKVAYSSVESERLISRLLGMLDQEIEFVGKDKRIHKIEI